MPARPARSRPADWHQCGGLVRFDANTARFHTYPIGKGGDTSDRKIYALADDHAGGVWIATDEGLDHLDLHSNQIAQLKSGGETAPRNFSVMQDRAGNLWLGNEKGLFVRHAGSTAFVRPQRSAGVASTVLNNQIWPCARMMPDECGLAL